MATRDAVVVLAYGHWLHAGKEGHPLAFVESAGVQGVIFGKSPLRQDNVHGSFSFLPVVNGSIKMVLSFRYSNTNAPNIWPLSLLQISSRLWLEEKEKE